MLFIYARFAAASLFRLRFSLTAGMTRVYNEMSNPGWDTPARSVVKKCEL